jgi:hypothetical protein
LKYLCLPTSAKVNQHGEALMSQHDPNSLPDDANSLPDDPDRIGVGVIKRRDFLQRSLLTVTAVSVGGTLLQACSEATTRQGDLGAGDLGADDLGADDLGAGDLGADDLGAGDLGADDLDAGTDDLPGSTLSSSVSQYGVTFIFAAARPVGKYANGDWWVKSPVTITSITPSSQVRNDLPYIINKYPEEKNLNLNLNLGDVPRGTTCKPYPVDRCLHTPLTFGLREERIGMRRSFAQRA